MTIRFGVSPIAWINDDMPELGGDTPLEQVLGDIRALGFAGVELGGKFPRDPQRLRALLDSYCLTLVGGWYSSSLLTRTAAEEIERLRGHLGLLQALGSDVFVIAETSNAIHGERNIPLSHSPRLSDGEWQVFGQRLTEVAEFIQSEGLKFAYHHHLGTVVETADDLGRFFASTGDVVGLTLDSGHAALGGIDAIEIVRTAPKRIAHVHCKDVRKSVFQLLRERDGSFLEGVLQGMFTVPGDGSLNFDALLRELAAKDYSGWVIIEAEQDPAIANPREYAELGLRTLRGSAAAVGLKEAA
jgi:inosose dehydratase